MPRLSLLLPLMVVVVGSACGAQQRVVHRSAAVSTPGHVGYGVTTFIEQQPLTQTTVSMTSVAAMIPPGVSSDPRDVIWTSGNDGFGLFLCRPTTDGTHHCQVVPLPVGAGPDYVALVDPVNRGNVNWVVSGGDQVYTNGVYISGSAKGQALTPHYGVWVRTGGQLLHCRVRDNQPECITAKLPGAAVSFLGFADFMSSQLTRSGDELRDVVWMATGGFGAQPQIVRCEGRPTSEPSCQFAKFN